jgi:serine beta-lactamase-like protein LACTB, mitochondrial
MKFKDARTSGVFGTAWFALAVMVVVAGARAGSFADEIEAARAEIRKNVASKAPGVSIAIGQDGKIVWSEGFGFADLANRKPVTPQTEFRIGSVSKPFTAVGLMLLVEQGKIDLDTDIHKYIRDFPDKGAAITPRELGGHLAGIRAYHGKEFFSNRHYDLLRTGLKIFQDDPLLSKPGEKYSYSSYGFNLIGVAMESVARDTFTNYMQQAVFTPLRMSNTLPDEAGHEPAECSRFYILDDKTNFVLGPLVDNSYKWPSGGFLSTPEDLVRFGMAMLQPGFLKPGSFDTMFTSQKTTAGKSIGYGIGWGIGKDAHGEPRWCHFGGAVGGSAALLLYPDHHLVIAIASNYEDALEHADNSIQLIKDDFIVQSK